MREIFPSLEKDNPCKDCIVSISIVVRCECITLYTLEGYVWKWGKAIRDGFHVMSCGWKYLAIRLVSATVNLSIVKGVWILLSSSLTFFPGRTNSSIESSTNWTSGLKMWGTYKKNGTISRFKRQQYSIKEYKDAVFLKNPTILGLEWKSKLFIPPFRMCLLTFLLFVSFRL